MFQSILYSYQFITEGLSPQENYQQLYVRILNHLNLISMKKILFALEVLLMLSALPVFFGLALGRKHHVTTRAKDSVSKPVSQEGDAARVVYPGAVKNS